MELAPECGWTTVSDTPDNNTTNNRARAHEEPMLPNIGLDAAHGFTMHLTHRVIAHAMGLDKSVGDVRAVFIVTWAPGHLESLTKAARHLVVECLVVAGPPPDRWRAEHPKRIVEHSLLRTIGRTCGALTHTSFGPRSSATLAPLARRRGRSGADRESLSALVHWNSCLESSVVLHVDASAGSSARAAAK